MPTLTDQARQAAHDTLALLDAAVERGDPCETLARALQAGHTLFLLADPARTALAEILLAAARRHFPSDLWPPLLTIAAETRSLALLGCEYGGTNPLFQQTEELVRSGDVALALAGMNPSTDFLGAIAAAASQGATVVGLGLTNGEFPAPCAITLPQAPPDRLAEGQLLLGHALWEALARRLPADPPPDVPPALLRSACTNCGAALVVPRHLAGRRGVCPYCYNNTVLAPDATPDVREKRTHMRFALLDCSLRVALTPQGKPPIPVPGQITLENLSLGGLLFAIAGSPLELQPGDTLALELSTPAFHSPLSVAGSIVRVTREATLHHVGVLLGELEPAVAERLRILERNLVLRHLTARSARP